MSPQEYTKISEDFVMVNRRLNIDEETYVSINMRRMKNRIAAQASRDRHKQKLHAIMAENKMLRASVSIRSPQTLNRYIELTGKIRDLENETSMLKRMVAHLQEETRVMRITQIRAETRAMNPPPLQKQHEKMIGTVVLTDSGFILEPSSGVFVETWNSEHTPSDEDYVISEYSSATSSSSTEDVEDDTTNVLM
jgi:hypothetical protein